MTNSSSSSPASSSPPLSSSLPPHPPSTMKSPATRSSTLLLLLLLLFFQFLGAPLLPDSAVSTAEASSITSVKDRHSPLNCCARRQLLLQQQQQQRQQQQQQQGRPWAQLPAVLLQQSGFRHSGNKHGGDRHSYFLQLSAFLTPAANPKIKNAQQRSSPLLTAARGVHTPQCSAAPEAEKKGKKQISCSWGMQGEGPFLPLRCMYTRDKPAPLFAGGEALARIPMSTKQLQMKAKVEQQAANQAKAKEKPAVKDTEGPEKRKKRTKDWRVVLHNDDIHTFECVENAITKTLPHISRARAYDIALFAHTNSRATILITWQEKATEVAKALQEEGLTISVLPDKLFSKPKDEKEKDKKEQKNK